MLRPCSSSRRVKAVCLQAPHKAPKGEATSGDPSGRRAAELPHPSPLLTQEGGGLSPSLILGKGRFRRKLGFSMSVCANAPHRSHPAGTGLRDPISFFFFFDKNHTGNEECIRSPLATGFFCKGSLRKGEPRAGDVLPAAPQRAAPRGDASPGSQHRRRGMEIWVGSAFRRTGPPRGTWRGTAKPPRTCWMQPVPTSPGVAAAWQQEAEGIGVQTPPPPTPKHLPLLAAAVRPPTDSCRCGEQTEHDSLHPPLPFSPKQNTHPKTGGNQAGKTRRSFDNYFKPPLSQEGAGLTPTTSPPAVPELPRAPHPDPVPAAGGLLCAGAAFSSFRTVHISAGISAQSQRQISLR